MVNRTSDVKVDEIKGKIKNLEHQLGDYDEGGKWDGCAYRCEDIAKLHEKLRDNESARKMYLKAMVYYEKEMWFDEALKLAKRLEDNRAKIYEKLAKIIIFSDEDKETQNLFQILEQYHNN